MSDADLVKRSARGDETAFLILYARHRDAVYRFAWTLLKSEADAEDVAQECFITLNRKAGEFDATRAQLRTWLLGVTRNLALRRLGRTNPEDGAGDATCELAAPDAGLEAALISNQTAEAVRCAVMALPRAQREAIVLFEFEEMSLAETAMVLGIDSNAVKARLHRGRESLRASLPLLKLYEELV
jgi:RNA polymerase sigma-70 factor (ECF subfamily)